MFSSNGVFIRKWGIFGFTEGMFRFPFAISVNREGLSYVADRDHNVSCFYADGTIARSWKKAKYDNYPCGLYADDDNSLYITDLSGLKQFLPNVTRARKWDVSLRFDRNFLYQGGISKATDSSLFYIADTQNNRIVCIRIP